MDAYALLKLLHTLFAIIAVGTNITYGVWLTRAARDPEHLPFVLRGVKILDDRLANPAYGLLLVTGLALILVGPVHWTTPWLLTALIFYAALLLLGLAGYAPLLRRQIAVLEAQGPGAAEYRRLAASARRIGAIVGIVVLIILYLMVMKPALWR